jgi:F0F1-type ATP synthase beta subunit
MEQATDSSILVTGIKVIDLIAPGAAQDRPVRRRRKTGADP